MSMNQDLQKLELPARIELFEIDASAITGTIYRYTPGRAEVTFQGNTYTPFPISIDGLSHTSSGAPARPMLAISAVDRFFSVLAAAFNDLKGARVSYFEVFEPYLAAGISSPPQRFIIHKKPTDNRTGLVFELVTFLDLDKKFIPGRQMLRDGPEDEAFPGLGVNRDVQ